MFTHQHLSGAEEDEYFFCPLVKDKLKQRNIAHWTIQYTNGWMCNYGISSTGDTRVYHRGLNWFLPAHVDSNGLFGDDLMRQPILRITVSTHSLDVLPLLLDLEHSGEGFNWLAPGRFEWSFRWIIFKLTLISDWWFSCLLRNCPQMNVTGPGMGVLTSQFPPFRYFPHFSTLPKHILDIEYHIYIWLVSQQISCMTPVKYECD